MDRFLTLTALRRVIQLFFFVLLVYGSLFLTTFYSQDKLTGSWPSLTCAYDKKSSDYCVLIPLQHQMDHRVAGVIDGSTSAMAGFMGTVITLVTFFILIVILKIVHFFWNFAIGFFKKDIISISIK